MIFVTVGTHEQPFDRLVKYIDDKKRDGVIGEEVVMQTGYSTYEPKHCAFQRFYPYQRMEELTREARIVVTHGGPSSFILPLRLGKVPVVVPRQRRYGEHVDDHQTAFAGEVAKRTGSILAVMEIKELEDIILNYDAVIRAKRCGIRSNNARFNQELEKIVEGLMAEDA